MADQPGTNPILEKLTYWKRTNSSIQDLWIETEDTVTVTFHSPEKIIIVMIEQKQLPMSKVTNSLDLKTSVFQSNYGN